MARSLAIALGRRTPGLAFESKNCGGGPAMPFGNFTEKIPWQNPQYVSAALK
jgi:hypothetical protein